MTKRVIFSNQVLPYLLLAPQFFVILVFFYGPATEAILNSFLLTNPFGTGWQFVWFRNFIRLFGTAEYLSSFVNTAVFSVCVMLVSLCAGLAFAVAANRVKLGSGIYKSFLIFPYAIAPVLSGVLWLFIFHPTFGVASFMIRLVGINWNPLLNGTQAMILVVLAASWKQISYNFVFFLAGLQSIPMGVLEAASVDGANVVRRFWSIVFPLLTPTMFFLMVVNVTYAFFDTFAIIDAVTHGGPGQSTGILVYKVYADGFIGLNLGSSSAQSVVLMVIVITLTVMQFRYIERKVQYEMT